MGETFIVYWSLWGAEKGEHPMKLIECYPGKLFVSISMAHGAAREYGYSRNLTDMARWLIPEFGQTTTMFYILQSHYIPVVSA